MEGIFKNKYRVSSARLPGWNYSSCAHYFITICTHQRMHYFGEVLRDNGGEWFVGLSDVGKIVRDELLKTPKIRPNIKLDEWIIMPNHVHMIFEIFHDDGANNNDFVETPRRGVSTGERNPHRHFEWKSGTLGAIVNQLKSKCAKRIKNKYNIYPIWQPRFYDHIIRDERALYNIRKYIRNNPAMWHRDRNNGKGILI